MATEQPASSAAPAAAPSPAPAPPSERKKSNPFGAARPREDNLKRAGKDVKELDEKIEARVEQVRL
jgi:hypothetical protein